MKKLLAIIAFLPLVAFGQAVTTTFRLEWDPNPESDMKEYRLYMALGATGEFKLAATVPHPLTEVSIISTNAGLHRFHARAVNTANLQSAPSNEVQSTPPTVPANVTLRLKGIAVEQTVTTIIPVP